MSEQNGTKDAPIEVSSIPTVVGINFGNSYASIAVLTKVGYDGREFNSFIELDCQPYRKAAQIVSQMKMANVRLHVRSLSMVKKLCAIQFFDIFFRLIWSRFSILETRPSNNS